MSLSLYVLTHNCARQPVNTSHLAEHLFRALRGTEISGSDSGACPSLSSAGYTADDNNNDNNNNNNNNNNDPINVLPDVVLVSLQELAPLGPAFLGVWYWLGKDYFGNVIDAVGLAARRLVYGKRRRRRRRRRRGGGGGGGNGSGNGSDSDSEDDEDDLYELVIVRNVGMVGVLVFVKRDASERSLKITDLWEAGVGCGVYGRVGNKGAVAVKMGVDVLGEGKSSGVKKYHSQLCFVSVHLAPHENAVDRRNEDWEEIVRGLVFTRVETSTKERFKTRTSWLGFPGARMDDDDDYDHVGGNGPGNADEDGGNAGNDSDTGYNGNLDDTTPLLLSQSRNNNGKGKDKDKSHPRIVDKRNKSSNYESIPDTQTTINTTKNKKTVGSHQGIYSPGTHLIVAGDLNYRTAMTRPQVLSKSREPKSSTQLSAKSLLANDQLTQQRCAGKTTHGLEEADIRFGPTYKLSEDKDDAIRVVWDLCDNDDGINVNNIAKNTNKSESYPKTKSSSPSHTSSSSTRTNLPPTIKPLHYTGTRAPSWCDRILFSSGIKASTRQEVAYVALPASHRHSLASSLPSTIQPSDTSNDEERNITLLSDHLPVCLAASIDLDLGLDHDPDPDPILNNETTNNNSSSTFAQLQSHPPFPLRRDWRARRIRARLCEIVVGCVVVVIQQLMMMMMMGRLMLTVLLGGMLLMLFGGLYLFW